MKRKIDSVNVTNKMTRLNIRTRTPHTEKLIVCYDIFIYYNEYYELYDSSERIYDSDRIKPFFDTSKIACGLNFDYASNFQVGKTKIYGVYSITKLHNLITQTYKNCKLNGLTEWRKRTDDGSFYKRGYYVNNMKNGLFTMFDEYGFMINEYSYLNDNLHGEFISIKEINIKTICYFKNGLLDGIFRKFIGNFLTNKINFVDGFKEGESIQYGINMDQISIFEHGQEIKSSIYSKNGKLLKTIK